VKPLGSCRHCRSPVASGDAGGSGFCCQGCASAYGLIESLGLERYYRRRSLDAALPPPRPDPLAETDDYGSLTTIDDSGHARLQLMIEGLHCAACVWLIETVLARQAGVVKARLNMTTRRLEIVWRADQFRAADLAGLVTRLGYRVTPYDPARLQSGRSDQDARLLRAMAVAGFAAGNIMLLSVSVWAGLVSDMGPATRDLMHWLSALIAIPAVAYAGQPFFRSAAAALAARRTNMDVPISLAVILATGVSLAETASGGAHAYFDAAVALLFFLLIGRFLDSRARSRARSAAEQLALLGAVGATVIDPDGHRRRLPAARLSPGMVVQLAAGERAAADGVIEDGASSFDASLVSGESQPVSAGPGDRIYAGTVNLLAPVRFRVGAVGPDSLLGEIARLTEAAEQTRGRYVALADRVARWYAPAVHSLALGTFLGWTILGGMAWQPALLIAVAVLIVTCPCALALAVPVVQVAASGRLFRHGVLIKSPTALERLAAVDMVVFDKTGTLTRGQASLRAGAAIDPADLDLAAGLAASSRHPLARALARALPAPAPFAGVKEMPGQGLSAIVMGNQVRLGNRQFCGIGGSQASDSRPELWLAQAGRDPIRFTFDDAARADAQTVVAALTRRGYAVRLMSGDRAEAVAAVAEAVGIASWQAQMTPAQKQAALAGLAADGWRVLMVGDGLNDAPALAAAWTSMSPASAADIAQTAVDLIFRGEHLWPVVDALDLGRKAHRLARQNLGFAVAYNLAAVPIAVAGLVTPLIAALAMSSSSLVVTVNALRLNRQASARGRL